MILEYPSKPSQQVHTYIPATSCITDKRGYSFLPRPKNRELNASYHLDSNWSRVIDEVDSLLAHVICKDRKVSRLLCGSTVFDHTGLASSLQGGDEGSNSWNGVYGVVQDLIYTITKPRRRK